MSALAKILSMGRFVGLWSALPLILPLVGCYTDLDYAKIKCGLDDPCPSGYACGTAGLCVNTNTGIDASSWETVSAETAGGSAVDTTAIDVEAVDSSVSVDAANGADLDEEHDAVTSVVDAPIDQTVPPADSESESVDMGEVAADAAQIRVENRHYDRYSIPTANSVPYKIALGPDGNVWFTEYKTTNIGRITPTGQVTEFATPSGGRGIIAGPDNKIWYTTSDGMIGRLNPSTSEAIESSLSGGLIANDITLGPGGNVWFSDWTNKKVGKVNISGTSTAYSLRFIPGFIVSGKDGFLWYGGEAGTIGRIDTDGNSGEIGFPDNATPDALALGPDGTLWFSFYDVPGKVAAITSAGKYSVYSIKLVENVSPYAHSVVAGPDGNMWFAVTSSLDRITPDGMVTAFPMTSSADSADALTVGADGCLWFSNERDNSIGRMCP